MMVKRNAAHIGLDVHEGTIAAAVVLYGREAAVPGECQFEPDFPERDAALRAGRQNPRRPSSVPATG